MSDQNEFSQPRLDELIDLQKLRTTPVTLSAWKDKHVFIVLTEDEPHQNNWEEKVRVVLERDTKAIIERVNIKDQFGWGNYEIAQFSYRPRVGDMGIIDEIRYEIMLADALLENSGYRLRLDSASIRKQNELLKLNKNLLYLYNTHDPTIKHNYGQPLNLDAVWTDDNSIGIHERKFTISLSEKDHKLVKLV
jgi:hypothetical protein